MNCKRRSRSEICEVKAKGRRWVMIQYNDIFVEVRQRVAAFQYWKEFTNQTGLYGITESDYLDEAYRFLYTSASREFIKFCAAKEFLEFPAYCREMEIEEERLI